MCTLRNLVQSGFNTMFMNLVGGDKTAAVAAGRFDVSYVRAASTKSIHVMRTRPCCCVASNPRRTGYANVGY